MVKRLHSTFSAETNTRDDETHMCVPVGVYLWACLVLGVSVVLVTMLGCSLRLQYIEDELAKKKGSSDKPEEVSQ